MLRRRWRCDSAARVCRRDLTPCSIPFLSASGAPRRYLLRQQTTALLFSFCRYSVRRVVYCLQRAKNSLLLISFVFIFFLPKKAAEGTGVVSYSGCASEMVCSEGGRHVLREFRLLSMYFCWEKPSSQADKTLSRICTELDTLPSPETSDKSKEPYVLPNPARGIAF